MGWHIAQINVATAVEALDHPHSPISWHSSMRSTRWPMAAPASSGACRARSATPTDIQAGTDPKFIVNMSVWTSVESLFDFAYKSGPPPGDGPPPRVVPAPRRRLSGALVGARRPQADGRGRPRQAGQAERRRPDTGSLHLQGAVSTVGQAGWPRRTCSPSPIASGGNDHPRQSRGLTRRSRATDERCADQVHA